MWLWFKTFPLKSETIVLKVFSIHDLRPMDWVDILCSVSHSKSLWSCSRYTYQSDPCHWCYNPRHPVLFIQGSGCYLRVGCFIMSKKDPLAPAALGFFSTVHKWRLIFKLFCQFTHFIVLLKYKLTTGKYCLSKSENILTVICPH